MQTKWEKMPSEVYFYLKGKGIGQKDILYNAETDLNLEGNFADGYLVLTGKGLGIFLAPEAEDKVRYFRGSGFQETELHGKAESEAGFEAGFESELEMELETAGWSEDWNEDGKEFGNTSRLSERESGIGNHDIAERKSGAENRD